MGADSTKLTKVKYVDDIAELNEADFMAVVSSK